MNRFNSNRHHRRTIRLKGYDYSQQGMYYITICCQNRIQYFGNIENKKMVLNDAGEIVLQCWLEISQHFPNVFLHEYVVMPNHVHCIVEIVNIDTTAMSVGARFARPINTIDNVYPNDAIARPCLQKQCINVCGNNKQFPCLHIVTVNTGRADPAPTIGNIVGYFKYQSTKKIDLPVKLWQRNYYERIIRDMEEYQHIVNYIVNNPANWKNDKFYKV